MQAATTVHAEAKIPVTVKINQGLANEITSLKKQYADQGKYFSITQSIELAIKRAVIEGKKALCPADETLF